MEQSELRAAIRAEVRSYLTEASVRYAPILAGVLAVALVILLVPDTAFNRAGSGLASGGPSGSVTGTTPGVSPATANPSTSPSGGTAGTGAGATGTGGSAGGGGGNIQGVVRGGSTSDIAASGVKCGPGVRQVPWSPYSPPCIGKWAGSNGGATSHGVTASTITLALRNPSDWDTAAQGTGTPTFAQIAADMQVLVDYFNTQYELYGRKVQIKQFNGQGSFFAEASNQDQQGASADAQTAYNDGAMIDGFPITAGTYSDAEAAHGIISFAPGNSEAAFKGHAPYMYGTPLGPVAEIQGAGIGSVVCQRMANMNAVFAGDATYQHMTRKFGILEPQQPEYTGGAAVAMQEMKSCGVSATYYSYSADLSTEAQSAAEITAAMKQAGITTAIMLTDPFMSQFMTDSAAQAQYNPEWVFTIFTQTMARQASAGEMAHSLDINPWHATTGPPNQRLCARIYSLASHGAAPKSSPVGLDAECSLLLALFAALQQAGPDLTPQSFSTGWFSVPASNGSSDFGRWSNGPNQWSPDASFSVLQWTAGGTSQYDGGTGGWVPCGGSVDYPYQGPNLGSGQLQCFGH
jgi:hypothetical protein